MKYETAIGQLLCVQAAIHHPRFLAAWWNFANLTLSFFGRIFLAFDKNGQIKPEMEAMISSKGFKVTAILNQVYEYQHFRYFAFSDSFIKKFKEFD